MQQEQHDFFDVAIVGYGPVSEIMALALARQGRSVAIFERWEERYPLGLGSRGGWPDRRIRTARGAPHGQRAAAHGALPVPDWR